MKQKQLTYEAVKELSGTWAVKTQYRRKYYTVAETYCIPGRLDAKEMAETIVALLNHKERVNNPVILSKQAFFAGSGANG